MSADDSEWITQVLDHTKWQVKKRYENLEASSHHAYGLVCFARDEKTGDRVAIKKLARPFDSRKQAKLAYRELRVLKNVSHENIVKLIDTFTTAKDAQDMENFYLVTNCMESTLHDVIKGSELDDDQIEVITYQILRALKYLHSCNIIHRDLKPTNIIINDDCDIQIIDFGLAKSDQMDNTPYVVTRWYRAPEIIFKRPYTKAVDIWSVGCVIAEMFLKRPLFKGTSEGDQLNRVIAVVGFPSDEILNDLDAALKKNLLSMNPKPKRVNFVEYFTNIHDNFGNQIEMNTNILQAIDLLDKMLVLDPSERITFEQALNHPFLNARHDPKDEPTGDIYVDPYESAELSIPEWKNLIFSEIQSFFPHQENEAV